MDFNQFYLFTLNRHCGYIIKKTNKRINKMKYKNNTISKEYRRLLKKITFNWSSYNGTDILKVKEYLVFSLNKSLKNGLKLERSEILKQNYYYNQ